MSASDEPHLQRGALVLLKRSSGAWIPATLKDIDDAGYVVEWQEGDGSWCHKVVSFANAGNIRPREEEKADTGAEDNAKAAAAEEAEKAAEAAKAAEAEAAAEAAANQAAEDEARREREEAAAASAAAAAAEAEAEALRAEERAAEEARVAEQQAEAAKAAEAEAAAAAAEAEAKEEKEVPAPLKPVETPEPVFHSPPRKPPKKTGDLLLVDGRGSGTVDEMSFVLDEEKVQFCLVQFPIGSGTFRRFKLIFIKWQGSKCPAMRRAKQVQRSGEVQDYIGSTHGSLTIGELDDCTLDYILTETRNVFVTDNGEFSIHKLKEEITAAAEEAKQKQEAAVQQAVQQTMSQLPKLRPTAVDLDLDLEKVMVEVRKPLGALNWILFKPFNKLDMINAGSESVDEMGSFIEDDQVMFGLLRLGFGIGHFRRVKWIAITFVGAGVGAVKRGQLLSKKSDMEALMKPHQISIEIQGSDDFTLQHVVEKVTPYIVADDISMKGKKKQSKVTLEDFQNALAEEKIAAAEFFGEDAAASIAELEQFSPIAADYDLRDTIEKIKSESDPLLWGVFSLNPDAK